MPGSRRTTLVPPLLVVAVLALVSACGANVGAPPQDGELDRAEARARAEALLGTAEAQLRENRDLRIVRRGDESRPVTMDLRPGRFNVELDDDGAGTYVVSRIVVETPAGEMPIEVEVE